MLLQWPSSVNFALISPRIHHLCNEWEIVQVGLRVERLKRYGHKKILLNDQAQWCITSFAFRSSWLQTQKYLFQLVGNGISSSIAENFTCPVKKFLSVRAEKFSTRQLLPVEVGSSWGNVMIRSGSNGLEIPILKPILSIHSMDSSRKAAAVAILMTTGLWTRLQSYNLGKCRPGDTPWRHGILLPFP